MAEVGDSSLTVQRREASRFFMAMIFLSLIAGLYFLQKGNSLVGFGVIFSCCPLFIVAGGHARKDELPGIPQFLAANLGGGG